MFLFFLGGGGCNLPTAPTALTHQKKKHTRECCRSNRLFVTQLGMNLFCLAPDAVPQFQVSQHVCILTPSKTEISIPEAVDTVELNAYRLMLT
jgi:hypothetical protein